MQKGRKGFDFAFAADGDEEEDGQPEVKTVASLGVKKQEFGNELELQSKVRPCRGPLDSGSFA